jgi:hypothetical protein
MPLTIYFSILPVVGNSGGAGQASAANNPPTLPDLVEKL